MNEDGMRRQLSNTGLVHSAKCSARPDDCESNKPTPRVPNLSVTKKRILRRGFLSVKKSWRSMGKHRKRRYSLERSSSPDGVDENKVLDKKIRLLEAEVKRKRIERLQKELAGSSTEKILEDHSRFGSSTGVSSQEEGELISCFEDTGEPTGKFFPFYPDVSGEGSEPLGSRHGCVHSVREEVFFSQSENFGGVSPMIVYKEASVVTEVNGSQRNLEEEAVALDVEVLQLLGNMEENNPGVGPPLHGDIVSAGKEFYERGCRRMPARTSLRNIL
ncbi:hypothetical protein ABEB36_009217 [Hypothenemus hampei]|uniref:Uncharacterized protein n=1 Tax=Hypothenemus hampei TaxID=57062 RepID=A0ABD1EPZ7_HYPHA